jgi:SAM-dependent methyltransferase
MTGEFAEFELAGWKEVVAPYDAGFARLTNQAVEPLLDAAGVAAGMHVLDVATGPGYVVDGARRRGARATGVDFSPAMVDYARERVPGAEFRVGDAEELPFDDVTFDAVVMNFGLMHLGRPGRALREAERVLRPGGRLALTVWAPPEDAVGFGIVLGAVQRHGDPEVRLPEGPPFFRFSNPEELQHALRDAGLTDVRVTRAPQTWRLAHEEDLFDIMMGGTVRTAALLRAQRPAELKVIRRAVASEALALRRNGRIELAMPAALASGRKPQAPSSAARTTMPAGTST